MPAVGAAIERMEVLPQPEIGLLVNVASFWVLSRGGDGHAHANLNVRSAALHVMGDLLGSVAAIAAAGIIMATGWMPIDPILSVLVAVLILRSAWRIVAESGHILLEGTPPGIDPVQVGSAVRGVDGVTDVHHVHAWSLTSERPLVTLHAVLAESADHTATLCDIKGVLLDRFGLDNLPAGAAAADLRRMIVPIYLFHRYQVTAASKLIGGVDYSYAVKGDAAMKAEVES